MLETPLSMIVVGKYRLSSMSQATMRQRLMAYIYLQTASLSIGVGTACTAAAPEVILEALVITAAIVIGLTAYAFHASRKGVEFSFMGPILISSNTSRPATVTSPSACSRPLPALASAYRLILSLLMFRVAAFFPADLRCERRLS